jgi:FkbM family methyltransferase
MTVVPRANMRDRALLRRALGTSVNFIPYRLRHWIRFVPGVAPLQRILVEHVLSGHSFVHHVNAGPAAGLKFEIALPLDKAIWSGTYERAFAQALARTVEPGDVCYDIGGYRGYMSGVMAAAGASKVLVFEPLPANQQALRRLCGLNPQLPIELVSIAVGNLDGTIQLKAMADSSMAKLANSTFQPEARSVAEIEVRIETIDSLVEQKRIPPPDVIKIDVEGAELEVLKGATDTLRTWHPSVLLEAHSAALEDSCTRLLCDLGYRVGRVGEVLPGDGDTRHLMASVRAEARSAGVA